MAPQYSVTPSNQIRVGQFDEHILERSPPLSEFAHAPLALNGEPENLFAHVCARFDSQREFLPFVLTIRDYVSNPRDLLQLLLTVIGSDLCFKLYAPGLSDCA